MTNARNSGITLTAYGAAQYVGGSNFLIETNGKIRALDVGGGYGKYASSSYPYKPKNIDTLILTHGHFDHMGNFPIYYDIGFDGEVLSTIPTADITEMQIKQESQGAFLHNKSVKGKRGPDGKFLPFKKYRPVSEINAFMSKFRLNEDGKRGFEYNKEIAIDENTKVTFFEAGHIMGSAQVLVEIIENEKSTTILLASDLGRTDYHIAGHPIANTPLVKYPEKNFPKKIDYVMIEATYGDRVHKPIEESLETMLNALSDAYQRKSKLITPVFAIQRSQMYEYFAFDFCKKRKIPDDMLFAISSVSIMNANKLYSNHISLMDEEAQADFLDKKNNPFKHSQLVYHKKFAETLELINSNVPANIIASSGMCDYGRIVSILEHTISNPNNIILTTGYASPGTRSYRMQNGADYLTINEKKIPLKAEVRKMGGLSGHADGVEEVAHLRHIIQNANKGEPLKGVFIIHGEPDNCEGLRKKIIDANIINPNAVKIMEYGMPYVLA